MLTYYLECFKEALKLGEVKVAYGRVMFIGEAGVGKSTLLGALMNKPLAAEATSTVMADTREVKCQWKRFGMEGDAYWCDLTEEDEVKELGMLAKQVMNIGSQSLLKDLATAIAVKTFKPQVLPLSTTSHTSPSARSVLFRDEALEMLSGIIAAARSVVDAPLELTADQYLNVWDCGGQRVFMDVLPAFLTSRTIFLLMFDASKDLQKKVTEIWNQGGKSTPLETLNLSSEDLMIQWMSCITASLSNKAAKFYKAQYPQDKVIIPPFPRIVIVGTHGDMMDAQKKEDVISEVKSKYLGKPVSDQVVDTLILDSTKRGNEEDPQILTVKRIIRDFISDALCIPTPIAWVLFRKLLTKLTTSRPIVALDNVAIISRACSIADTTLSSVLSFYHELGAFLHYVDIDVLKDNVITQPEWLVKHLGAILAPKGSGKRSIGPAEAWRLLRKKGILVEALYQVVWETSIAECEVKPQAFADLLERCFLIAEITQGSSVPVPKHYGKRYFMPCALSICPSDAMETPLDAVLTAAPLHLTFSSTYVPPGYFVRLATVLSKSHGFSIAFHYPIYSNRITFQYGDGGHNGRIDDVTISGTKLSIRIDIVRRFHCLHVDKYNFPSMCRFILKILLGAAHDNDLRKWFPFIEVSPEFQCECSKDASPHFAVVSTENESLTPLTCRANTISTPTPEQQLWLKIPAPMDKEGILYHTEIDALLNEMNEEDFIKLSKALEMKTRAFNDFNSKHLALCRWSCKMGNLARSHLVYHLGRTGLVELAERIDNGYFPKNTEQRNGQDEAHVYSVVTDEELVKCSVHIGGDADLSILAAHLSIPVDRDALTVLKLWKQQHKSQAYKQTLLDVFTSIGRGFEKASRVLNGDGPDVPDMATLQSSIGKCAPHWYQLGLHLGIEDGALRVIETDCPNDCKKSMTNMLRKWLEMSTNPTWRIVVTALRAIGQTKVASDVERKRCQP